MDQKDDKALLLELLARDGTTLIGSDVVPLEALASKCSSPSAAVKCTGIRPKSEDELIATFQVRLDPENWTFRIRYRKENRLPRKARKRKKARKGSRGAGQSKDAVANRLADEVKASVRAKKRKPWIIYTGGFETNRSKH